MSRYDQKVSGSAEGARREPLRKGLGEAKNMLRSQEGPISGRDAQGSVRRTFQRSARPPASPQHVAAQILAPMISPARNVRKGRIFSCGDSKYAASATFRLLRNPPCGMMHDCGNHEGATEDIAQSSGVNCHAEG